MTKKEFFLPEGAVEIKKSVGKFDFMISVMDFNEVWATVTIDGVEREIKVRFTMAGSHKNNKEEWYGNIHILPFGSYKGEIRAYTYNPHTRQGTIRERGWKFTLIEEKK